MSRDEDEELVDLLSELERTLADLRAAVGEDVRERGRRRGDGAVPRRRPPTPGELLRFTEEYTIPTLIALLEATVQSLELLRAVLRLAGPRPTEGRLRERLSSSDGPEVTTLREALADLRGALTDADLPEESAAGSILADARSLTAEIDERLAAVDDGAESGRSGGRTADDRGVDIDVREEPVDVESELTSIKESMEEDGEEE
ncbi:DUF7547 family protein [Haloplanus halophilus]|uniref:DUF7547 family protein n=1 Tax=Haloplanus halophilus TaxID=2949993 RepID=UPI00203AE74C|nr:hypothetical protein [Haloplanus sp. GDY1]